MKTHIGIGVGKYIEKELFAAKHQILISTPYISLRIARELIELLNKKVEIKIILSDTKIEDYKKSIEILKKNKSEKLEIKVISTYIAPLIHAKIFIIDNKLSITGSANLTEDSFENDPEFIIIDDEKENINQIKNDFTILWDSYSNESTIDQTKSKFKKIFKKFK